MPEISQEELELLKRYKSLGTVEELSTKEQEASVGAAAQAAGYKKTVLERLLRTLPDECFLVASENGAAIQTPEGEVELTKFAETEWAEFLPSLKNETGAAAAGAEKKPVTYIRQAAQAQPVSKATQTKKRADSYIDAHYGWTLKTETVN